MNILIIEDEVLIARAIETLFSRIRGVNIITHTQSSEEGLTKALSNTFDLVLVDIMLRNQPMNGLDICRKIRERNQLIPIIVITAIHSLEYLEEAFQIGVNDYLTKPFQSRELELRSRRWFGMCNQHPPQVIEYEGLRYNVEKNLFSYDGHILPLSKKNKTLMQIFIKNPEKLLSQQFLMEKYWGDLDYNPHRNIRSSIQNLRKALGNPCWNWIQTTRGEGYTLKKETI